MEIQGPLFEIFFIYFLARHLMITTKGSQVVTILLNLCKEFVKIRKNRGDYFRNL